jgi:hypothetical protein
MVTNRNTTTKVSIKQSTTAGSMLLSLKFVFSHWAYIALAGTISTTFWIVFNVSEKVLFFSPIVVFYLPIVLANLLQPTGLKQTDVDRE